MLEQALNLVKKSFGEDNVDIVPSEDTTSILVRLEPFTITNEKDQSHEIKGLWLRFNISCIDGSLRFYRLQSRRSYQTAIEYTQSYFHSHLPGARFPGEWNTFCKGDGEFNSAYEVASQIGINLEAFETLLMLLHYFLTYEDLSNPYKRIENILPIVPLNCPSTLISDSTIIELARQDLHFDNEYNLIDNRHNQNILISYESFKNDLVVKINGQYGKINDSQNSVSVESHYLFDFQGKPVYSQVETTDLKFQKSIQKFLHPQLFKRLSDVCKYKIKSKLVIQQYKEHVDAREAYYNSISKLPESNKILVYKNI